MRQAFERFPSKLIIIMRYFIETGDEKKRAIDDNRERQRKGGI